MNYFDKECTILNRQHYFIWCIDSIFLCFDTEP